MNTIQYKSLLITGIVLLWSTDVAAGPETDSTATAKDSVSTVIDSTIPAPDSGASAAPAFGRLHIVTDPESAVVIFDSLPKGRTPVTMDSLAPGIHGLTIKKKGFYLFRDSVEVIADSLRQYTFTLSQPGRLVLVSKPSGASVYLDGKKQGVSPYKNSQVKPGTHVVRIELPSYDPVKDSVVAESGKTDSLYFALDHTQAYRDSVAAFERQQARLKSRIGIIAAASVMAIFGIVVFIIEIISS
jgi:hypothetical protein